MDEKIVYAALPKEDVDDMFEILGSLARLMDQMADDPGMSVATQKSARESAEAVRLKIKDLRVKVQIL